MKLVTIKIHLSHTIRYTYFNVNEQGTVRHKKDCPVEEMDSRYSSANFHGGGITDCVMATMIEVPELNEPPHERHRKKSKHALQSAHTHIQAMTEDMV